MDNNIRALLEEHSSRVSDLIKETGLAKSFVYDVINGKSVPTLKTARLIADFLNSTIDEVFPKQELKN